MRHFIESERDSLAATKQHFYESVYQPIWVVLIMFLVHFHQWLVAWDPAPFGVFPRRVWGMTGILTGPFIHGSWGHLVNNSIPMFVLYGMIWFFFRRPAFRAFLMIYILTGIAVWVFGRPVSHIGASGVVFGLFGFMLSNGIFRQNAKSILLSLLTLMVYGGMFLGLEGGKTGISYESHWAGFFAGIFASFWFKEELEADEMKDPHTEDPHLAEKRHFLPQDIFEKTKEQRAIEAAEAAAEAERLRLAELEELERLRLEQEAKNPHQNPFLPPNLGNFWDSNNTLI